MNKMPIIIDSDDIDLDELGINYTPPSYDDVYQLLWGLPADQPIPAEELQPATVGVQIDE